MNVYKKLQDIYNQYNRPPESTINRMVRRFQPSGLVKDQRKDKNWHSQESVNLVCTIVVE